MNKADETLIDYSFLSRYHYTKSKNYLKRRYRIRHWIPMFIGTLCIYQLSCFVEHPVTPSPPKNKTVIVSRIPHTCFGGFSFNLTGLKNKKSYLYNCESFLTPFHCYTRTEVFYSVCFKSIRTLTKPEIIFWPIQKFNFSIDLMFFFVSF